jgi:hypothetical protein
MNTKYNITIPKPCHENWNAMTPSETGRFCSSCTKNVVDFTTKNATEIQSFFIENQGKSICGRFKNEQLGTFNLEIPQSVLQQKRSFRKAFLLTLFVVMGSTLFSCKNQNDASLGEVSIVSDSTEVVNRTQGTPIFKNDSVEPKISTIKKKPKDVYAVTVSQATTGVIAANPTLMENPIEPKDIQAPTIDSIKTEK